MKQKYIVNMGVWPLEGYRIKRGDIVTIEDESSDGKLVRIASTYFMYPLWVKRIDIETHCVKFN